MTHFEPSETQCRCGCGSDITPEMLTKLNKIRDGYGKPISLTSGRRCEKHNIKIGGAPRSSHISGMAADLVRTPELAKYIIDNLEKLDLRMESLDQTPNWIHIDLSYPGKGPRIFRVGNKTVSARGMLPEGPTEEDMNKVLKDLETTLKR